MDIIPCCYKSQEILLPMTDKGIKVAYKDRLQLMDINIMSKGLKGPLYYGDIGNQQIRSKKPCDIIQEIAQRHFLKPVIWALNYKYIINSLGLRISRDVEALKSTSKGLLFSSVLHSSLPDCLFWGKIRDAKKGKDIDINAQFINNVYFQSLSGRTVASGRRIMIFASTLPQYVLINMIKEARRLYPGCRIGLVFNDINGLWLENNVLESLKIDELYCIEMSKIYSAVSYNIEGELESIYVDSFGLKDSIVTTYSVQHYYIQLVRLMNSAYDMSVNLIGRDMDLHKLGCWDELHISDEIPTECLAFVRRYLNETKKIYIWPHSEHAKLEAIDFNSELVCIIEDEQLSLMKGKVQKENGYRFRSSIHTTSAKNAVHLSESKYIVFMNHIIMRHGYWGVDSPVGRIIGSAELLELINSKYDKIIPILKNKGDRSIAFDEILNVFSTQISRLSSSQRNSINNLVGSTIKISGNISAAAKIASAITFYSSGSSICKSIILGAKNMNTVHTVSGSGLIYRYLYEPYGGISIKHNSVKI